MIRYYLSGFLLIVFSITSYCQLKEINVKVSDNLQKYSGSKFSKKSITNPKKCGMDTIEYPRYKSKASTLPSIGVRKNYSLGQIYGAPQDVNIHGFTFYSWISSSTPTDKKLRLICNLYKAGTDSLPSGSPLASDTITIDTSFGGTLASVAKHAKFKNPITVNYPYIITVESDSVSLVAAVVTSSWSINDGKGENLLCGSVSGKWYRGLSLNISGSTLDADILLSPHVTYKFGTDFRVPDCFDFKDSARFKNNSLNNVAGSKFYSLYSYYKIEQYTHQWNYGEMPWNYNGINGLYKYNGKGNFKIRLITSLYQWHGNNPCVDTTIKIMYFKPKIPEVIGSANICRGDTAKIMVASDTGTTIKWFRNPTGSPVHTGAFYNLGQIQSNDTFYLKAYNYACESAFNKIIITVNDYPQHPVTSDDSICLGAKANLEAKANIGNTEWSMDSTYLPFYTGNVLQTGSLTKDVSYFVRVNNNGCYSPFFKSVTAYVDANFAPKEPLVSNDTTICLRPVGIAVLKAYSPDNDSLRWFDVPSGGISIANGNTFVFTASSTGIKTIYVETQKSTCASSRLGINVTVSDYPTFKQVFGDERCKGDTAQLSALLNSPGIINWYDKLTGGNLVGTGSVIQFYTFKTLNLYAEAGANGCLNPIRSTVNIKINAYDSITKIDAPIVCGNAKVTLKVTAGTNLVKWYEDAATSKIVASTATFTTPKLLVSTNYYFTVSKNGCTSPVYTVLAEVLPLPVAGYNFNFISGHKLSLVPYETSGVSYKWVMGDGNVFTSKYVTHKYTVYGTYNVKLVVKSITSGCIDSTSQDILYDFSGVKPIINPSIKVFPNPAVDGFTISLSPELAKGKLSIYGVDGKLVLQKSLTGLSEIEINEKLISGSYIIKVASENRVEIEKLIIR